ncbi:MAG: sugar transferase [Microcoleus sp. PH2017_10_PVI_O_A]|uniref:Npun_R2821/Npun_R2822 family protein n=1 Tax=unclassified Microcoleus TaxID=2642155 RepID=UPI001D3604BA|nr:MULTISPECIES: Npun_R2821/Npun_R2822 family protein [unclassified Microcoleus]TAE82998.1 MAG: sugar transferase [Oscillatoriales cyanobacterium]MCC3406564.1 sugar transferase [Microcoleus sp. PH2017_10_PVI_O_A]MCC3460577.1 sugar transferase [Microcoleus sp. PH2017_11_PCY_U_A]MCC3479068.1 sugar transferase [Microcoleus sp. PH2017_12_PCY_D_A]MCC3528926.1 sugar transferase [Microcoleus sp. PH2017_21_RUC_O_A]
MNGICTLANDTVCDQLIALLNSIEVILGLNIPVCIYPFDDHIQQIKAEIVNRPNVFIYEDSASIQRWDKFMQAAAPERLNRKKFRLYGAHRRFCAFDGPFEKFIYMDADTLVMNSLDAIFQKLELSDFVVYDFQFRDPTKVYNIQSPKLLQVFEQNRIDSEIFCSGFYGSKQGLFDQNTRDWLVAELKSGDAEILYSGAGEQPLLNYMVMKTGINSYNFARSLPDREQTGCSVTSQHFEEQDNVLYDKGNRLTYIHYIGVQPDLIRRVCAGENIEFPYRDLFLHYRYLREPEKRPIFREPLMSYADIFAPNLLERVLRRLRINL